MLPLLLLVFQESVVERYLAEPDAAARAKILSEVRGSVPEVEAEIRKGPARPDVTERGTTVRQRLTADHPLAVPYEYALWVPAEYTPERRWRLLVSLHGQGSNGDAQSSHWLGDVRDAGDTFLLCPSAGRGGWGRSRLGHAYILGALRDVTDRYAIDPDLVFIDGASMGGNGSFEFACLYPDRFAGAAPRSGGPRFRNVKTGKGEQTVVAEMLENLVATPVYWVVGAKDEKVPYAWVRVAKAQLDALRFDFTYREYPEGGHEWFPQENARVLEWMSARRRDAYPPRVAVYTHDRAFNRNFWLEIAEFRGKENVQRRYNDLEGQTIEERLVFLEEAQARAELFREKNEIRISTSGVKSVRVYLHEAMVDFTKPVVVAVNGSKNRLTVKPSRETLLESARRDRGLLYSAAVTVKAP